MSAQPMNALLQLILQNPRSFERSDIPCALWGHHEAALVALEKTALALRNWGLSTNMADLIGTQADAGIQDEFSLGIYRHLA